MKNHHIRNERATREKYDLIGKDLPDRLVVAWCGQMPEVFDFVFLDASHALMSLHYNGGQGACHKCLRVLRKIIDAELGE